MTNTFEVHNLNEFSQPFIFHCDELDETFPKIYSNWHENIEILCFTKGEATVFCDGDEIDVSEGDVCIINSNLLHTISTSSQAVYYCLIPDNDFCRYNSIDPRNINFKPYVKDEAVCAMIDEFHENYSSANLYREGKLKSILLSLLVYLAENHSDYSKKNIYKNDKTKGIQLAIGYIKSHIDEKLTIELLASEANLSKYYFLREFKKLTGDTPVAFINKARCENAKKMLTHGSYAVSEICEKCGFDNLSYFAKVFKSYTGMTPTDFVKKEFKER